MMMAQLYFIFSSGGNDSVATIQAAILEELPKHAKVYAVYCDTGWAAPHWAERVERIKEWCSTNNIEHVTLMSEGFETLVRTEGNRKGEPPGRFPSGREKFCTRHLKILLSQRWMDEVDPDQRGICLVGVRRAESERRRFAPVFVPRSENHGWRSLWHPLAEYSDNHRDALVNLTPIELLSHRSEECEPCIFSSRADLRRVSEAKVDTIRRLEADIGKTMFRPAAYAGAQGIDEIMRWAWSERGKYKPDEGPEPELDCESDFCGL